MTYPLASKMLLVCLGVESTLGRPARPNTSCSVIRVKFMVPSPGSQVCIEDKAPSLPEKAGISNKEKHVVGHPRTQADTAGWRDNEGLWVSFLGQP